MSTNMQRLGETLVSRMRKSSNAAVPTTIELGTIGNNLTLITDSLPVPIPKGDYMINLMLASSSYNTGQTADADGVSHSHALPSVFRSLKEGDRVLVAWCGNEPIVVSVVVSS